MHGGTSGLAAGIKAGQRSAPPRVNFDAAHHIVRRRGDGGRLFSQIQAVVPAKVIDGGKAALHQVFGLMGYIQKDRAAVGFFHFRSDGTGNHIPGGQIGQGMIVGHKGAAILIPQHRPLAAHRFRQQETGRAIQPQGGGMKLIKLQIHYLRPGPESQGYAIAGSYRRIGGIFVKLPAAAGADDNAFPAVGLPPAGSGVQGFHADGPALFHDQARGEGIFQHGDVGFGDPLG